MPTPVDPNARRRQFVENFAETWNRAGSSSMDGRVLGYLLVMDEDYISSADLGRALGASLGSISVSTRRLVENGMVRRHWIPGDRSHYFTAEIDPWGSYLGSDFEVQHAIQNTLRSVNELIPELNETSRTRIQNAADYFTWIESRRLTLIEEWEEYKKQRDNRTTSGAAS